MVTLEIHAELALREPDIDIGLVTWIDVRILARGDGAEKTVGTARAALILVATAAERGASMHDVLDADSGELEALYEYYFDEDGLRDEYNEGAGSDVLYVSAIELEPPWRGRCIELAAVRRLCDTIGHGCGIAVVRVDDDLRAHGWKRMGFEVTVPAAGDRAGCMHLRLAYRAPRIIEDGDDRYRVVSADDEPK